MSETDFLSQYLREIGVKTPVSLLFCAQHQTVAKESMQTPHEEVIEASNLAELEAQAMHCEQCHLSDHSACILFGTGNEHADIMLISDVPHDVKGESKDVFTDDASALLNHMLNAIGVQREQVYETHLIQCATPNHRDPNPEEWLACQTWLQQKIKFIQPKLILLLGRVAAQTVLQHDDALNALREGWHDYQGVPTRVLHHPAYLLRSPRQKQKAWKDLQQVQIKFQNGFSGSGLG